MKLSRAAVIGGGVIGAGWIARLVENAVDVRVYDPAPGIAEKVEAVLANADRAMNKLTNKPRRTKGVVGFFDNIGEAVEQAESVRDAGSAFGTL